MLKNKNLVFLLLLFPILVIGQIRSRGIPFITNYGTKDYKGAPQNWASIQDNRGVLFFGNNDGVLEYDGTYWNTIKIPNKTGVRSFGMDAKGVVYVGAQGDFGFLKSDASGQLFFVSILPETFAKKYQTGDIWRIFNTKAGMVFQDLKHLYLYNGSKLELLCSGEFEFASYVNDKLIVPIKGKGLFEIASDKQLRLLQGSDKIPALDCAFVLPLSADSLLVGTYSHGLFVYANSNIASWKVAVNPYFIKNGPYSACLLFEGKAIAFGTSHDGLVVTDKKGNVIQHISRTNGLTNATVLSTTEDKQGNLWLGLGNGIAYVEINSTFSYTPCEIGLGYASCVFNNQLYLGTNEGLLQKPWSGDRQQTASDKAFQFVPGTGGQIWNLNSIDAGLFIGKHDGAMLLDAKGLHKLTNTPGVWNFTQMPEKKERILSGTYNGLILFEKVKGLWMYKHKIKGFDESSRFLEFDADGQIWISHGYKGVFKLRLNAAQDSVLSVNFYNHASGFPSDIQINLFKIQGEIVFAAEKGFYMYDKANDRFKPAPKYNKLFGAEQHVNKIVEDADHNIWFCRGASVGLIKNTLQGYDKEIYMFNKLSGTLLGGFENIYPYGKHDVVIATQNGVVYYDAELKLKKNNSFKTLIRKVQQNAGLQKKIAGGYNAFLFLFAATYYEDSKFTLYQHYLKGFDADWSPWLTQNEKEYTNLPEGAYTFNVRAKNSNGVIGETATYSFTIIPPWYRTRLAYLLYTLGAALLIYFSIKKYKQKLEAKNRQIIKEKERELALLAAQHAKKILEAEKQLISIKNESLKTEVAHNNKELTATTMYILHKNEALKKIKDVLLKVIDETSVPAQADLKLLIATINKDMDIDKNWQQFEIHFDQLHDQFLQRMRLRFQTLSPTDLKLCAYLRINLTTKDIAPLLNISVRGVEIARYRLRKKLNLTPDVNLLEFILNV